MDWPSGGNTTVLWKGIIIPPAELVVVTYSSIKDILPPGEKG